MAFEDIESSQLDESTSIDQIHERMAGHRASIANRLETLEQRLEDRLIASVDRMATDVEKSFNRIAESIAKNVDVSLTEVQQTVGHGCQNIRNSLEQGASNISEQLDFHKQFKDHPLTMLCASIFAGVVLVELLQPARADDSLSSD